MIRGDQAVKHDLEIEQVQPGFGLWVASAGALIGLAVSVRALRRRTAPAANPYRTFG